MQSWYFSLTTHLNSRGVGGVLAVTNTSICHRPVKLTFYCARVTSLQVFSILSKGENGQRRGWCYSAAVATFIGRLLRPQLNIPDPAFHRSTSHCTTSKLQAVRFDLQRQNMLQTTAFVMKIQKLFSCSTCHENSVWAAFVVVDIKRNATAWEMHKVPWFTDGNLKEFWIQKSNVIAWYWWQGQSESKMESSPFHSLIITLELYFERDSRIASIKKKVTY